MNLEQQQQWDAWARAHITTYLATIGVDWISSLLAHECKQMAEHVGTALGKLRVSMRCGCGKFRHDCGRRNANSISCAAT